jgi:hypothetical protein
MPILNWSSQSLGAESSLTYAATSEHPQITIPLFVSEYPMPSRVQKFQEINTPEFNVMGYPGGTHAGFFGAQEQLQTQLSGFLITPMRARGTATPVWDPTATGQSFATPTAYPFTATPVTEPSLNLVGISNPELILAYMEGRMEKEAYGARVRKDPSQFTDPYGNIYTSVYVMAFESTFTVTAKKQTFTMTLRLEP